MSKKNNKHRSKNRSSRYILRKKPSIKTLEFVDKMPRPRFVFRRIIGPIPVDFTHETSAKNQDLHAFFEGLNTRLARIEKRLDAIDSRLDDIKKTLCYNKENTKEETVETKGPSQANVETKINILIDDLLRKELMQGGVLKLDINV